MLGKLGRKFHTLLSADKKYIRMVEKIKEEVKKCHIDYVYNILGSQLFYSDISSDDCLPFADINTIVFT